MSAPAGTGERPAVQARRYRREGSWPVPPALAGSLTTSGAFRRPGRRAAIPGPDHHDDAGDVLALRRLSVQRGEDPAEQRRFHRDPPSASGRRNAGWRLPPARWPTEIPASFGSPGPASRITAWRGTALRLSGRGAAGRRRARPARPDRTRGSASGTARRAAPRARTRRRGRARRRSAAGCAARPRTAARRCRTACPPIVAQQARRAAPIRNSPRGIAHRRAAVAAAPRLVEQQRAVLRLELAQHGRRRLGDRTRATACWSSG